MSQQPDGELELDQESLCAVAEGWEVEAEGRAELVRMIEVKDRLILSLSEKLLIVAEHLGRLSERKEVRGT